MRPEDLRGIIRERLARWGGGLGPTLRQAWEALWHRLRLDQDYFGHPLALPVLELPLWQFQGDPRVRARGEDAMLDAAESAAAGYLHVRIQDDLLDEGTAAGDAGQLMLAEALGARHQRLCMQLAGGAAAFASLFEARWTAYAEAMALDSALGASDGVIDRATEAVLLQRTAPLVLPAAALAAPVAPETLGPLDTIVTRLAAAHQLVTDAIDVEKDLRNGNQSLVLARMGAEHGADHVRRALYVEGGLDRIHAEARAELEAARDRAPLAGVPGLAQWVDQRIAVMERVRAEAFRALFAQLVT
ncbi:MAG: geranylgeranyl pyrophosphate synthase [Deltaproteobacteria bacterium]|nr:MAG: geranylgeranyl pyrophosphate synthase [Deltaproteobacteria bacterium]